MFERLGQLSRYIKNMNNQGMDMLIEAARDINSNKKLSDGSEGTFAVDKFDRDVNRVLRMLERGHENV